MLAALLLPGAPAAVAGEATLRPPRVQGLVLDGTPGEAGWAQAAHPAFDPVEVPSHLDARGPVRLAPDVRVALCDGRLCFAVRMQEPPGSALGLHLMIAPQGTRSAAQAVSLDFRPLSLRGARYRVDGPRGSTRAEYGLEGAVHWDAAHAGPDGRAAPAAWTLEAGLPVADVSGEDAARSLRLAVVVYTRTPNVVAGWPAAAMWHGPDRWALLAAPEGGWPAAGRVDRARMAREDEADARRRVAWLRYLKGAGVPVAPTGAREDVLARVRRNLLQPLDDVLAERPDLEAPVMCLVGDVYHRLGLREEARESYRQALHACPLWTEARYGWEMKVRGPGYARGAPGGPSDYAAARAAIEARAKADPPPRGLERDGLRLGRALLDYDQGRFRQAEPALAELSERFPFDAWLRAQARLAHVGVRSAGEERLRLEHDRGVSLPRARIGTTRGAFVLELFQADVPNAVANFVWLARHGFYDGLAVHHAVPFFALQSGDPHTREGAAHPELVGSGGPGYAIHTQVGPRRPLRGYVAWANAGPDTEGSQFLLFTGSALHLQGQVTVFGRVVEGMDVVDALRARPKPDRILSVHLEGLEAGRLYRPNDLSGQPAPEPVGDGR
jgi:peptidyl-prolyl cis-trans isomerase B (cyclophilin B)